MPIYPDTGTQTISEPDIRLITHKAGLLSADLINLFGELNIPLAEQERNSLLADTKDFMQQSFRILYAWLQNEGKAATRNRIIEALRGCKLNNAAEFLIKEWGLSP